MSPQQLVEHLRERIAFAEGRNISEDRPAATFAGRSMAGIGVRAKRVAQNADGINIYMLTLAQCRRLLARTEAALLSEEDQRGDV